MGRSLLNRPLPRTCDVCLWLQQAAHALMAQACPVPPPWGSHTKNSCADPAGRPGLGLTPPPTSASRMLRNGQSSLLSVLHCQGNPPWPPRGRLPAVAPSPGDVWDQAGFLLTTGLFFGNRVGLLVPFVIGVITGVPLCFSAWPVELSFCDL